MVYLKVSNEWAMNTQGHRVTSKMASRCEPAILSRAVNPPSHQILRIDREEMIDDYRRHHLCQKCSLIPIDVYST